MHASISLIFADTIIEARWVCPVVPSNTVLENQSVIVQAGKITEICATEFARTKYVSNEVVQLNHQILIPGLINLHTHAAMSLMRGLADDLPLMPWLQQHIWPAEQKLVSPSFVRDGTLLACAEMLSGGVTCFNDMYFFPESAAAAVNQAGMRANLGLVVIEFPSAYANDADDYLQKGFAAHDGWRNNLFITSSIAPHAPYTVSNKTFESVVTYAEQLGLSVHTHLHETLDEIAQSVANFGVRPMQRLADLGLLGPNLIATHCVHLQKHEIDLLAEHGCYVAHCPTSNLKLASGIAPITQLLAQGVTVGLGTDGAASNNRLDIFAEMRLSALLAKGSTGDAAVLPAHDVLAMATLHAAQALGLDEKIGSIEVGKYADLTAVNLSDFNVNPCYDPISHLIYVCGREHVTHTWVAGELRYSLGAFANIEPNELKEIMSTWQPKLRQHKR
ncbi:MAG: TRZ/ATZ family hydrolase [Methylotenera sp.]|jgi:5-methylthioadenosine/S-adenosylhomocysteine deaminase|nr:TRZ/ATZ family hydrolase [Methylotenera sp.]HPH08341.1 TRZ/ATZ family hydrolase [Methylotenera sp.]HPM48746.1 TRZ/ATZ family hydrolase [Methylotenera sp.]